MFTVTIEKELDMPLDLIQQTVGTRFILIKNVKSSNLSYFTADIKPRHINKSNYSRSKITKPCIFIGEIGSVIFFCEKYEQSVR